jgi:hypothetical protein
MTTPVLRGFERKTGAYVRAMRRVGCQQVKNRSMAGIMLGLRQNRPFGGPCKCGYGPALRDGCPMMGQIEGGWDVGMKKTVVFGGQAG